MTPRTLKWALVVSLVLNLLVVGWLVGSWALHRPPMFGWRGLEHMAELVPETQRDEVEALIEARRAGFEAAREEVRAARQALDATMRADPFDRAAAEAAFATLSAAIGRMTGLVQETVLDIAETVPADVRRELADARAR